MFLPGESQGQGSLVGCCLWGRTESDTTEATWQQQQYRYLQVAYLLTGSGRGTKPLQFQSVKQMANRTVNHAQSIIYSKKWSSFKADPGLQFLTFPGKSQTLCLASSIEQWAMTRSRLHHRTILFSWCSPFQNHAILCRKWRMTILVLGFPFRSVCHFCSLWWMHFKELKGCLTGAEASILGWELLTSRRVCFF